MLRATLVLLACSASAFRLPTPPPTKVSNPAKAAVVAGALGAMLAGAPPAFAGSATEAAVNLADAAYPIVGDLQAKTVAPLTGKVVSLALTSDSKNIIKTIDMGLDAFLSSDSGKFIATVKALKAATAEASGASSCNLVCLPSVGAAENVAKAAADALGTADGGKVKAFVGQAIKTVQSGDKMALVGLLADGSKFASSLNPGDVAKATSAALELGKATGAL